MKHAKIKERTLLVILIICVMAMLLSCKKKVTPPTDPPPPICTPVSVFVGAYNKYAKPNLINISLISNGCPIQGDSNVYLVTGMKEAVANMVTDPKYALTAPQYTLKTRSKYNMIDNVDKTHGFSFSVTNDPKVILLSLNMPTVGASTIYFVRN